MKKPFGRDEGCKRIGQLVASGRLAARKPSEPVSVPVVELSAEALDAIPDIAMPYVDEAHEACPPPRPRPGLQMAHAYNRDGLAACVSLNPGPTCNAGAFRQRFQSLLDLCAWFTFVPTLRFYRLSPAWALALPAIAFCYMLYTLDSAYQYARGRGGRWKGRVQANVAGS